MFPTEGPGRILAFAHVALLIVLWLIPAVAYEQLPDQIAVHFNSHGQPDKFAAKSGFTFWSVPVMGTAIGLALFVLLRFPQLFNHPRQSEVKVLPAELRAPVYDVLRNMMLAVFICMDLTMIAVEYFIVTGARTGVMQTNWWIILLPAALPLALLAYYLPKISRTVDQVKARAIT